MQTLEVAINFNMLFGREFDEFGAAYKSGVPAVRLLLVQVVDRDSSHVYVRISNQTDIERIVREVYKVRGLKDIKRITNHLPGGSMSVHLELVIDIKGGSKYLSNTQRQSPHTMNEYNPWSWESRHYGNGIQVRNPPAYLSGHDPYRSLHSDPKPEKKAKEKSKKILLLM